MSEREPMGWVLELLFLAFGKQVRGVLARKPMGRSGLTVLRETLSF